MDTWNLGGLIVVVSLVYLVIGFVIVGVFCAAVTPVFYPRLWRGCVAVLLSAGGVLLGPLSLRAWFFFLNVGLTLALVGRLCDQRKHR